VVHLIKSECCTNRDDRRPSGFQQKKHLLLAWSPTKRLLADVNI